MTSEDSHTVQGHHSSTNLYLRGLPATVDDAELRRLFEPFGEVMSAMVMLDIHTGESLGTAFVRFTTHPAALAAKQYFCPNPPAGHMRGVSKPTGAGDARAADAGGAGQSGPFPGLVVQWARKEHDDALVGEARQAVRKLFLRNIPQDVDGKMLFELVKPYGLVDQVTLHVDTFDANGQGGMPNAAHFATVSGRSSSGSVNGDATPSTVATPHPADARLIAFVTFSEDGAAAAACDALHNTTPFRNHGGIPVMAKLAEDTRQRTARRMPGGGGNHNPAATGQRAPAGHRASFSMTSTAHGARNGQASAFSAYHMQPQQQPTGFSTFQEMEANIYPSAMQSVAYSQPQPLSAARTDVYSKSAPLSANQHYYGTGGMNYSADMVVPPRPPTVPLSSHTTQNYYSAQYPSAPGAHHHPTGFPVSPHSSVGPKRTSLADLDTLSQAQGSHYEGSNADTASSNSRFRHNPYNAVDPQTLI